MHATDHKFHGLLRFGVMLSGCALCAMLMLGTKDKC